MSKTKKIPKEIIPAERPKVDVYSRLIPVKEKPYFKITVEAPDGGQPMPLFITNDELEAISKRSDRSKEDFGESAL